MNSSITSQDGLLIGAGERTARLDKVGPLGLLVGVVGAIICVVVAMGGAAPMIGSWIFGWYFWLTITLGMFGLSILNHTIRPSWSVALLRLFEAGGGPMSILLMGVLFLPIVLNTGAIYEWANAAWVQHDLVDQFKSKYLNFDFWSIRYLIYFAIWFAYSLFMRNSVRRQEANQDFSLERGRSSWGAFGIVTFMLTVTFGIIDWIMSMEAHWSSTMFGLWQIIAASLGGASFAIIVACLNAKKEPYDQIVSPKLTKDWGNILFMLTMLWAYTAVSQFLIIWNGNLPEYAQYYARRSFNAWNFIGFATIVGQFLVPWMSLLSPRVKRYPRYLSQIALWIFCVHIVDVYLAVGPATPVSFDLAKHEIVRRAAGQFWYLDVLTWFTVGGFWLWMFASQVKKAPLLLTYDTRLQEALSHAH